MSSSLTRDAINLNPRSLAEKGEVFFADANLPPRDGTLVICLVDGELQIKRYRQVKSEAWLETRLGRVKPEECENQGVVIEKNTKLR